MEKIGRKELIKKYIEFFKSRGHKEIPNSSLIPANDPTVLFTTAGMHPLVPYLLGQPHPLGKRLVNVQRCIRTQDIDEVGDTFHHTFFEMLGNWSLGDYFKNEAIKNTFEFHTKVLGIPKEKYAVTVFGGDKNSSKDEESEKIWLSLGVPKERIAFLKDNWWGPAGSTGPCGPDTEQFFWSDKKAKAPAKFNPQDKRWIEIGNDVLMQYVKDKRVILVDGMHCIYDKDFNINLELLKFLNDLNTHTILTVAGFREKGKELVKTSDPSKESNWEAFSLEEKGIKKDNPEFYKKLLEKFNLSPSEVIYFEHDKNAVKTAEKVGIMSKHYTGLDSIKKFIEDNLVTFIPAKQKNIDFGGGVERTVAALNGLEDNYLADMWKSTIEQIEKLSGKKYGKNPEETKAMRIIADHLKAAVFIIADGVKPSNTEQGYVLRRLIRRAIRYGKILGIKNFTSKVAEPVFKIYDDYGILKDKKQILKELDEEEEKFEKTLEEGLKILNQKVFEKSGNKDWVEKKKIIGTKAFLLYQSYGFPLELTQEIAKEKGYSVDVNAFNEELKKHQQLSRTAAEGRFKSGLADNSQQTTRLHTATHMLNAALKEVLKDKNIHQKGSNITPERLRFDFNFPRKLTDEELKAIEELINKKISAHLEVKREELSLKEALASGAEAEFGAKYPEKVSVYTIIDPSEKKGFFSREICTGPHVRNTSELGHFKIKKEESSSAGVRRIKAVVED